MGAILHAIMHEQAQRRRAAKAKHEPTISPRRYKEKDMINFNGQPKTEEEVFKEQMAFVLMAKEADKEAAAKKAKAEADKAQAAKDGPEAAPTKTFPPDAFERLDRSRGIKRRASEDEPEQRHKPYRQPGPGLLLKLAHWLNLK